MTAVICPDCSPTPTGLSPIAPRHVKGKLACWRCGRTDVVSADPEQARLLLSVVAGIRYHREGAGIRAALCAREDDGMYLHGDGATTDAAVVALLLECRGKTICRDGVTFVARRGGGWERSSA